jgi:UMF1 family MFS transporter
MKEEIVNPALTAINASKNQPRILQGWAFFDWANSAYALVITVAIFPGYFLHITADKVKILGLTISDSALYSYSLSFAYLLIALVSPLLSGIADYGGRKKSFLRFFTTLGALACMGLLFFTNMHTLWIGVTCFILATIGFSGGLVFYNAFLPEIATEDRYDNVSATGFSYGFAGSIILLVTNLVIIQNFEWFGFSESLKAVPVAFVMVGLWWLGFAQIPFRRLPEDARHPYSKHMMKHGYEEVKLIAARVLAKPNMLRFLSAFFFANAGTQSVLYLASIFAEKELHFNTSNLIVLILILQIVGIGGAYFFAWVSSKRGNKFALVSMLFVWTLICFGAYVVKTGLDFYFLAACVGLVMGGMQSLARATYAKLLPENTTDTASYFSFYDILDKLSTVMGTFVFGLIETISGGMRNSVLSLAVFFVISIFIMWKVKVTRNLP